MAALQVEGLTQGVSIFRCSIVQYVNKHKGILKDAVEQTGSVVRGLCNDG